MYNFTVFLQNQQINYFFLPPQANPSPPSSTNPTASEKPTQNNPQAYYSPVKKTSTAVKDFLYYKNPIDKFGKNLPPLSLSERKFSQQTDCIDRPRDSGNKRLSPDSDTISDSDSDSEPSLPPTIWSEAQGLSQDEKKTRDRAYKILIENKNLLPRVIRNHLSTDASTISQPITKTVISSQPSDPFKKPLPIKKKWFKAKDLPADLVDIVDSLGEIPRNKKAKWL